ncbi:MAG: Asp-tRNA(Asn)/Glu-tRNA(Gln) amidotransferase subunit GatA [Clostridia bacterium]|nr:Asp-tRNA(Asn)/Glu-tRNA(Gln) amidotransferase subunit GatA [Clostridia bacterium]
MAEIYTLTVTELKQALADKSLSAKEIWAAFNARIDAADPHIGAFLTRTEQSPPTLEGPLSGIPFAIKDAFCTNGVRTTAGSRILDNFVPPYTATVVERLEQAGMASLGKLSMDEFAMGNANEHCAFGPVCNPQDLARVPGGSSGGSAAAVAAGMAPFALGSDTGGSVRQPAAFCGVVGFKPTYGLLSRYGLIAYASSLDTPGLLTRSVKDAQLLLPVLSGHDRHDSTSLAEAPAPARSVKGLRVGLPKEYFGEGVAQEVKVAVLRAAQTLRDLGAEVSDCSLPMTKYALPVYYLLACAEASSNLARYDGVRYGMRAEGADWSDMMTKTRTTYFGEEVKRRIMLGTFVLSAGYYDAYYLKAQKGRTLIRAEFDRAFEAYDLLLTPTSPVTAWERGSITDPISAYAADICTVSVNLGGLSAASIPCGRDSLGLPVGAQLIGNRMSDNTVLAAAAALEEAIGWDYTPVCGGKA